MPDITSIVFRLVEEEAEPLGFRIALHAVDRPECAGGKLEAHVEKEGVFYRIPLWYCTSRESIRRWLNSLNASQPGKNGHCRNNCRLPQARQLPWLDLL